MKPETKARIEAIAGKAESVTDLAVGALVHSNKTLAVVVLWTAAWFLAGVYVAW